MGEFMKKFSILVFVIVSCLTCTGCIDIFQHITRLPDGSEQNTIKITVSKILFEMAGSFSGEEKDYAEFFNDKEIKEFVDMPELKPFSAKISKVNNLVDLGYLINMNIDYNDKNILKKINSQDAIDFIPKYTGEKAIINLSAFSKKSKNNILKNDESAMAFLASGKYRLLIDKSCITNIGKVVLKNDEKEIYYTFLDLYNQFLIEIPIPILFSENVVLEIYF